MRTRIFKLFVFIVLMNLTSCSTDDVDKDLGPNSVVSLTFNMETTQDQMGDFADNAMALFDGKVWSFGGTYDNAPIDTFTNELWNSTNGENWATVPTNGLTAVGRRAHTLTSFNGKLYIIGGEDSIGNWLSDIWVSDDGITWTNPFGLAPFGEVTAHQTIVYQGKMYVIAGDITTGNTKIWSTMDGLSWIEETNNAFSARGGHKAVVHNDTMYVIGGENIASTRLNEIWRSTDGISWTQVTTSGIMFSPRGGHTATTYNNKVWVIGGRDDSSLFKKDIWYSSNMIEWTQYDDFVPLDALAGHVTLKYNNALWIFGGYKSSGTSGAIWSIKED